MIINRNGIHHFYNRHAVTAKSHGPEVEKKPMNNSSRPQSVFLISNPCKYFQTITFFFWYLFYRLSTCKKFNSSFVLPATVEFIFVKCESIGKTVYKNTHAIIRDRPNIRQRLNEFKEKSKNKRPLSVLMLSIDSVSRLNLIRAMPKTAQHLYDSGWFELQGYNKVSFVQLFFFTDFCFNFLFSINYDWRTS